MKNQLAYSVLATMMLLSSLILTISVTAEGMEVGYISFTSNRRGNYDIYIIDRHGENLQRLIGGRANEVHARWSPNGRFLAYASDENTAFHDIYVRTYAVGSQIPLIRGFRGLKIKNLLLCAKYASVPLGKYWVCRLF